MEKGCYSRIKKLFFHPKSFFSGIEKEKVYSQPMFFYVKIYLVYIVLNLVISFLTLLAKNTLNLDNSISIISSFVIGVGMAFIAPFIFSGIIHLGVLIFRGKQGFFNAYKPLTYSLSIGIIYSILAVILSIPISILFPISANIQTASPDLLFKNTNFLISLIISGIIMLISLVHVICASVIGLSKFQKLSKSKAFFSIVLIPLILFILLIIVLSIVGYNY